MIRFKRIELDNFGSYGHAEVDLRDRGFCLVSGKNEFKADNAASNGSGKSFLWSAICFAIVGETINGLHSGLVNVNMPEGGTSKVILDFDLDSDSYEITRTLAPKSDLKITKNGEDVGGKGLRESEKKLRDLLPDVTQDYIASTIVIGQGMPHRFSSFSPSGRKELLEHLTKSDYMIEDIKAKLDVRQCKVSSEISAMDASILVASTKLQAAEASLEQTKQSIEALSKPVDESEEASLREEIARLEKEAEAQDLKAKAATVEQTKLLESLNAQKDKKTSLIMQELSAYNEAYRKHSADKAAAALEARQLKAEISRLKSIKDVCPTCGQKLPGVVKPDTSAQEKSLQEAEERQREAESSLDRIAKAHEGYGRQIGAECDPGINEADRAMRSKAGEAASANAAAKKALTEAASKKEALAKIAAEKATRQQRLSSLDKTKVELEVSINSLSNSVKTTQLGKAEYSQRLAVLKKMDTLAKRDFRGYLLQNVIAYLDKKAKSLCQTVFGTDGLSVFLEGNALSIEYMGKAFDNLSGGEKQRVDLILQFAIRDLLNAYFGASSNILVLDEITDFLDKKSCRAVMDMLESELSDMESVFIVSHHADELPITIDSELRIVKDEAGVSHVE